MNLKNEIEKCTAHRLARQQIANAVLADESLFAELFACAIDTKIRSHFKGCWILELVLERKIALIEPFLETFCTVLKSFENDSSLRSVTKICLFISSQDFKNRGQFDAEKQTKLMIEFCFDCLISEGKVAMKAYAMRALFHLGRNFDWIHPELKIVLQNDFSAHSAAYKVATRELLKKLPH